ncbi:isoprenylcysteine carboxylmethyltransferase family protein [Aureimonas fodinaquatilis]|uniref:Isoprenylcysteine carboxylmethyltransferase family protein n=1 Tax=Aureimonas fodinaquatilis TaxID=2565783 RepID=A0A5B0DU79_9HYPH|nr:methyltransferase [Aureimonas fodinaquatilis]KAA0969495.1 isoprenylcysteine carboxylmethyltransferase family protein [Aureimonas fodinaquatilis]
MIPVTGWVAFAALTLYLMLFFTGTFRLAKLGQRVWLFGTAKGRDRLAAIGFRLAFVLALLGPVGWSNADWRFLSVTGSVLACSGAMLALVAQLGMAASWRVGVVEGETGDLVTSGLFAFSRNPTFVGQALLLAGVALALPGVMTGLALVLFILSANAQIRSEEAVLLGVHGQSYARYLQAVPRWIGRTRSPS